MTKNFTQKLFHMLGVNYDRFTRILVRKKCKSQTSKNNKGNLSKTVSSLSKSCGMTFNQKKNDLRK